MEGACVYVNSQHNSVLVMYKEVEKNKVLLNPTFDVVDLTKIKNIQKKLKIKL